MLAKLQALERLPTVRAGLRALGMTSLLDWFSAKDRIRHSGSPFTHPLQAPYVFLPGLRARMFHDRAQFPWATEFEAHYPIIRRELEDALTTRAGFQPYRTIEDGLFQMADNAHGKERDQSPGWNMMYLYYLGSRVEENCRVCPRTAAALAAVPRFPRSTIASFSALNPSTHVTPHCGPTNAVTRVHLGIKIPAGCRLRVGDESVGWQEGKLLFFDDSFEHQVWHTGRETRFVLFFDVWHPDWKDEEIAELNAVFRCDGEDGLVDFTEKMQSMRLSDRDFLVGKRWWT
jgi:aspartyl/asparaginyl beta-hydroxylase (cupin superfamily)